MSRISYIAIMCREPETLKDFYGRWFGFEEIQRLENGTIYLSDGALNMGLMKQDADNGETNQQLGLHHIGFLVDSVEQVRENLRQFDASATLEPRPASDPFAEFRTQDSEGIPIDVSEKGYGVPGQKRIPGIRHIALANDDPQRKFEFYSQVLGMRDAPHGSVRSTRNTARYAGDGFINLALLKWPCTEPRRGFNHFGILAPNPQELMYKITDVNPTRLDTRPADRFAEFRIWDPESNALDLSATKGFQVDTHQIDRIE
jgi:catechol 2,3-dioxygenase-like lactoylglutathione lyase family enzyme